MAKFEIRTTPDNIEKARSWKANKNRNTVQIAGKAGSARMTRTFTQASLAGNYEVTIATEGNIPLDFQSNKAI